MKKKNQEKGERIENSEEKEARKSERSRISQRKVNKKVLLQTWSFSIQKGLAIEGKAFSRMLHSPLSNITQLDTLNEANDGR